MYFSIFLFLYLSIYLSSLRRPEPLLPLGLAQVAGGCHRLCFGESASGGQRRLRGRGEHAQRGALPGFCLGRGRRSEK